jgi:hypothetical protein
VPSNHGNSKHQAHELFVARALALRADFVAWGCLWANRPGKNGPCTLIKQQLGMAIHAALASRTTFDHYNKADA